MKDILLGVNVDHIATLRQARGTNYPDPVYAASVAEHAGADGITVHLREDRRHIQDRYIYVLKKTLQTRMNLEMAVTDEMLIIACDVTTFVDETASTIKNISIINYLRNMEKKYLGKICGPSKL